MLSFIPTPVSPSHLYPIVGTSSQLQAHSKHLQDHQPWPLPGPYHHYLLSLNWSLCFCPHSPHLPRKLCDSSKMHIRTRVLHSKTFHFSQSNSRSCPWHMPETLFFPLHLANSYSSSIYFSQEGFACSPEQVTSIGSMLTPGSFS